MFIEFLKMYIFGLLSSHISYSPLEVQFIAPLHRFL